MGGGVSRPTPRGEVRGLAGGVTLQAHTWGGVSRSRLGGVSQHALRQTPPPSKQLLLRAVRILECMECILVMNIFEWTNGQMYTLVFFRNCRIWHYWHFCGTSNGNILEIVANQMNANLRRFKKTFTERMNGNTRNCSDKGITSTRPPKLKFM